MLYKFVFTRVVVVDYGVNHWGNWSRARAWGGSKTSTGACGGSAAGPVPALEWRGNCFPYPLAGVRVGALRFADIVLRFGAISVNSIKHLLRVDSKYIYI